MAVGAPIVPIIPIEYYLPKKPLGGYPRRPSRYYGYRRQIRHRSTIIFIEKDDRTNDALPSGIS